MFDQLAQFFTSINLAGGKVITGAIIFLLTFFISNALVMFFLVKLPEDYFCKTYQKPDQAKLPTPLRWMITVGRNMLGFILLPVGVVLSLPGIVGPGFLIIFIGILLLDFPGKRELERKIIRKPRVLNSINNLRKRFSRPPLIVE